VIPTDLTSSPAGSGGTFALTYLFISHDLAVVRAMWPARGRHVPRQDRRGGRRRRAVLGPVPSLPKTLLAVIPQIGGRRVTAGFALEGEPPNRRDVPSGCRFRTRWPLAAERCAAEESPLGSAAGRLVACHFA
jgi:oligopeptide/dipeptide ABC transporter ATP-binding protein